MTEKEARDRIFLTVDFADLSKASHFMNIARDLHGLKIDSHQELPLRSLSAKARAHGVQNLYLDAKSSDGTDQMPLTMIKAARQGADYLSLEVSAGASALRAAVNANEKNIKLVGVTIPSDMPEEECFEIYGAGPKEVVPRMASIAVREGLKYITCSAHEAPFVRAWRQTRDLTIIATGIRMPGEDANDQQRIATPAEALRNGVDKLGIGRSITEADDHERAVAHVIENMRLVSVA